MRRSHAVLTCALFISAGLLLIAIEGRLNPKFDGHMRVPVGRKECLAVGREPPETTSAPDERGPIVSGVLGSAIPFQNPETARNWIDPKARYVVAQLPFFVRLDDLKVKPRTKHRCRILVTSPEGESSYSVTPGETLSFAGVTMRVKAVRKWSGLLREQGGRPMASVTVRQGEGPWSDKLFVTAENWLRVGEDVGLLLHWVESEETARSALAAGLPRVATPRWCVVDRGAANWFTTFVPGTGVDLAGGGSVTLLQFREGGEGEEFGTAAIQVAVEREGKTERRWVFANQDEEDGLVRLDHPLMREQVFVLLAWQGGQALAAAYRNGEACESVLLDQGGHWEPEGAEWSLRLEKVMASAVPVKAADSPLYEAAVEIEGEKIYLREGEAVRWNELLLRFRDDETLPPLVLSRVTLVDETGAALESFGLYSGQSAERLNWRFAQLPGDRRAPEAVAKLNVSTPATRSFLGLRTWGHFLLVGGLGGLLPSLLFPMRRAASRRQ